MRRLPIYLILMMMLAPSVTVGQSTFEDKSRGGSVYSSFGVGIPAELFSPFSGGMGLRGVSLFDPYTVNASNPALWGGVQITQGTVTVGLESLNMRDSNNSAVKNYLSVDHFQLVVPVMRSRLGASLTFTPVTRSVYSLFDINTFQADPGSGKEPLDVVDNVRGRGGVNKMELGLGLRVNRHLAIGYAGSIYFTTLLREVSTVVDDPRFRTIDYDDTISGNAFGNRFGIYGRIPDLFREDDEVSAGASVTLPVTTGASRETRSFLNIDGRTQSIDIFDGDGFGPGNIELPLEYNIGFAYRPGRWLSISAEYLKQKWSEATFSYNEGVEQYYTDRTKTGIGLQFLPYNINPGSNGFFESFKYNVGVSFDNGHLNIDGRRIESLMFHTGIGILSPNSLSSIDLSFHVGTRGTTAQSLVKERIWGMSLSLNLSETMFRRQKFQ